MKGHALIIGGTGFCGPYLVEEAKAAGWHVRVMSRQGANGLSGWHRDMLADARLCVGDMVNPLDLNTAMEGVDMVIHAASASKSRNSDQAIEQDIDINLKGTVAALRAAAAAGVPRFVYLSSAGAIYGPGRDEPYRETDRCQPISSYGIIKQAAEQYIQNLGAQVGMETLIARVSNPFGPGQTGDDGQGVMAVFYRSIQAGRPIRIFGQGDAERDYIAVDEAMRAVWKLSTCSEQGVFNVASGQSLSVLEVVSILEEILGRALPRQQIEAAGLADLGHIRISNAKLVNVLGWAPSQNIKPALRAQIAWMKVQQGLS